MSSGHMTNQCPSRWAFRHLSRHSAVCAVLQISGTEAQVSFHKKEILMDGYLGKDEPQKTLMF